MDAPSDAPAPDLKQKRRKRWGTETDQGLKILEAVQTGADGDAGVAAAQPTLPVEPLPRKKKSRWAQEEELLPPPPPLLDPSLLPPGAVLLQAPVAAPLPPPPQPDQGSDHAEITKAIAQVSIVLMLTRTGCIKDDLEGQRRLPADVANDGCACALCHRLASSSLLWQQGRYQRNS